MAEYRAFGEQREGYLPANPYTNELDAIVEA
jgi:hypothetical protein